LFSYEGVAMSQLYAVRSDGMDVSDIGRLAAIAGPLTARFDVPSAADASMELLRTISEVLDIRRVFPRVSELANHVLPHDGLALVFLDGSNQLTLEARSTEALPEFRRLAIGGDGEPQIVRDLRLAGPRLAPCDPPDVVQQFIARGYRSLLMARSLARRQAIGLMFLSKRPDGFAQGDGPAARRLADYVALAVSHEQLAEAERHDAEARVRAERFDNRVQSLVEGAERKAGAVSAIGQSPEWKDVLKRAMQVAATETTVSLLGESGTGKEVIARLIHRSSARRSGPFVAINCAALPEQLLESELFGYERGAFTGAQQSKPGQIEMASGGVLFLDEVSEMLPAAQAKLLRVLQEREFLRLGGTRMIKANVRVIAATNRDLRDAVARGTFREDLYYRLQVFDIRIPPLRDRASDIPLFVDAFLQDIGRSMGGRPQGVTAEARAMLVAHSWPGNVRELRNVLERAAILCEGGFIGPRHLSLDAAPAALALPGTDLGAAERQTIERVLRETDGNKAKAARRLGLTRTQLYVRLRKYDLDHAAAS
jgi:transcriptional regulator with GAF, ATPase, and Fis domain